jgi:hypothetical protein
VIYVEPLVSCAPTTKDIRIFEQKHKSRELEEELKTTLNFLKENHYFYIKTNIAGYNYFIFGRSGD